MIVERFPVLHVKVDKLFYLLKVLLFQVTVVLYVLKTVLHLFRHLTLSNQRLEHSKGAFRCRYLMIATLQNRQQWFSKFHESSGNVVVCIWRDGEATQRVVPGCVETAGSDDQVRLELLNDGFDDARVSVDILIISWSLEGVVGKLFIDLVPGNIDLGTKCLSLATVGVEACVTCWVEYPPVVSVHRNEEDCVVLVEYALGAVSVVHIVVKDDHFLGSVVLLGVAGCDGSAVEDAEAVDGVLVARVVTWRTHQTEGVGPVSSHDSVDSLQAPAHGQSGHKCRVLVDVRVEDGEVLTMGQFGPKVVDIVYVLMRVSQTEFFVGCFPGDDMAVVDYFMHQVAFFLEEGHDAAEALRTLGMVLGTCVIQQSYVTDQACFVGLHMLSLLKSLIIKRVSTPSQYTSVLWIYQFVLFPQGVVQVLIVAKQSFSLPFTVYPLSSVLQVFQLQHPEAMLEPIYVLSSVGVTILPDELPVSMVPACLEGAMIDVSVCKPDCAISVKKSIHKGPFVCPQWHPQLPISTELIVHKIPSIQQISFFQSPFDSDSHLVLSFKGKVLIPLLALSVDVSLLKIAHHAPFLCDDGALAMRQVVLEMPVIIEPIVVQLSVALPFEVYQLSSVEGTVWGRGKAELLDVCLVAVPEALDLRPDWLVLD